MIPPYTWTEIHFIPDDQMTLPLRIYKEVLAARLTDPEQDMRGEAERNSVEVTEAILKLLEEA